MTTTKKFLSIAGISWAVIALGACASSEETIPEETVVLDTTVTAEMVVDATAPDVIAMMCEGIGTVGYVPMLDAFMEGYGTTPVGPDGREVFAELAGRC
jgi:hypothetical protein